MPALDPVDDIAEVITVSVEWEDASMDRLHGAPEALAYLKRFDYSAATTSFDSAFSQE